MLDVNYAVQPTNVRLARLAIIWIMESVLPVPQANHHTKGQLALMTVLVNNLSLKVKIIIFKACKDWSCKTCSSPDPYSCSTCDVGWYLTGQSECIGCGGSRLPDKCTKCTADNKCSACEWPYFLSPAKECESCWTGYYPTSTTKSYKDCKSMK